MNGSRSFAELALEACVQVTRRVGMRRARVIVLVPTVSFFLARDTALRRALVAYAGRRVPGAGPAGRLALAWRVLFRFSESLLERMMRTRGLWARDWHPLGADTVARVREAMAEGRGAVLVTAHVGRWAEAAEIVLGAGLDPVFVMDRAEADSFTRFQERVRQPIPRIEDARAGATVGLRLLRHLRQGEAIAIMGDRLAGDRGVEAVLLGAPVRLPRGPFQLAAASGAPWFAVASFAGPDGRIHTLIEGPFRASGERAERARVVAEQATEFARCLERWTARYPEQWFNFEDLWLAARDAAG